MATTRREFLESLAATPLLGAEVVMEAQQSGGNGLLRQVGTSVRAWRQQFPALADRVNGHPLTYLDSAATTQRPSHVIDALVRFYLHDNGNPGHSGARHTLARRSAERLDEARHIVATFLNAADPNEIVWVRGTTEAINLVASSWGGAHLRPGDEILLTISEHYSNLVPWQLVSQRTGATLRFMDIDDNGRLRLEQLDQLLSSRTKLVAFSHVSNVLGLINPASEICARARKAGAKVLIDGAQSAPHIPIDVQALGCDFYAFSAHKMLGPMGIGVLWARRELLDAMPPYQAGANMAHDVEPESAQYAQGAHKFQAGTPNVSGPVGLAAAIQFLRSVGHERLTAHERALARHALDRLTSIEGLRILGVGPPEDRIALFSFTLQDVPVSEIVTALDRRGIAVRGGDLASLPLLKRLGVSTAARASCYLYTTVEEIDRLAESLTILARHHRRSDGRRQHAPRRASK